MLGCRLLKKNAAANMNFVKSPRDKVRLYNTKQKEEIYASFQKKVLFKMLSVVKAWWKQVNRPIGCLLGWAWTSPTLQWDCTARCVCMFAYVRTYVWPYTENFNWTYMYISNCTRAKAMRWISGTVNYVRPLPDRLLCMIWLLSVSSLPLSVMVHSCHVCVIFAPGFFHVDAALWQVYPNLSSH